MPLKTARGKTYSHPFKSFRFPVTGGRRQGRMAKTQQDVPAAVTQKAALRRGPPLHSPDNYTSLQSDPSWLSARGGGSATRLHTHVISLR